MLGKDHASMGSALFAASFTVTGAVVIGVPAFLAMRRKGWLRLPHFLAGGALIGALLALPLSASGFTGYLIFARVFAGLGAAHASAFWLISVVANTALQRDSRPPRPAAD